MTFSFIETPFTESSQLIALPVILYILKDNESIKTLCSNSQLEMALLLGAVFISKTNFQASVYLMITFIMLRLLGNCKNPVNEEFQPVSSDDMNETADLSLAYDYDQKGTVADVVPDSNNLYMQNINSVDSIEPSSEPSAEPSSNDVEPVGMDMGMGDITENYQSF